MNNVNRNVVGYHVFRCLKFGLWPAVLASFRCSAAMQNSGSHPDQLKPNMDFNEMLRTQSTGTLDLEELLDSVVDKNPFYLERT